MVGYGGVSHEETFVEPWQDFKQCSLAHGLNDVQSPALYIYTRFNT